MQKVLWFKKIFKKSIAIFLFNDNIGIIVLMKNLDYKSKIKHIKIR